MKTIKHSALFLVLLLTIACAAITRQSAVVERDAFLNKFPMLNNEILGELKYDNPDLDLKTVRIKDYTELFEKIDITDDYKKVVYFVLTYAPERKLAVQQKTFIICLRSPSYKLVVCDDAATPIADKTHIGEPVPLIEEFCAEFLDETH